MTTNRRTIRHGKRWNYPPEDFDDRPFSIEEWRKHRDQIMQYEAVFGKRPAEWRLYEHNMERPHDHEGAVLYEMGNELRPEELDYLMGFWRQHFDLAMSPHFAIPHSATDVSKGSTLTTGLEAQRLHLEWAGIPHSLLKRWHAERRKANAAIEQAVKRGL